MIPMMTLEERLNGSLTLETLLAKLVTATLHESLALLKGQTHSAEAHRFTVNALKGQILDHYHAAARGGDLLSPR